MVTPITAPTSTSVGASAPRATRAVATIPTTPAATHLPMLRPRPAGTIVYSTPTTVVANALICTEGIAQPPQLVWMPTPNGRGRWTTAPTPTVSMRMTSSVATTRTMRWRKRRSTNRASTSADHSAVIVTHEPTLATLWRNAVRPGACNSVNHLTMASSAAVTVTARPRRPPTKTKIVNAISTAAATSQPTPLVWRWCGNGGGAPVGRRRRGARPVTTAASSRRWGAAPVERLAGTLMALLTTGSNHTHVRDANRTRPLLARRRAEGRHAKPFVEPQTRGT